MRARKSALALSRQDSNRFLILTSRGTSHLPAVGAGGDVEERELRFHAHQFGPQIAAIDPHRGGIEIVGYDPRPCLRQRNAQLGEVVETNRVMSADRED